MKALAIFGKLFDFIDLALSLWRESKLREEGRREVVNGQQQREIKIIEEYYAINGRRFKPLTKHEQLRQYESGSADKGVP